MNTTHRPFEYRLKIQSLQLGDETFRLETLENLDETIDQLFEVLQKGGNPELLEELCPYFGVIWPAANALAEHLAHALPLQNKTFLELGCGLALPSLLAAKKSAKVVATDFHPEVEIFLKRNMELNSLKALTYCRLDWKELSSRLGEDYPEGFEIIAASDVLYEKQHPEILAQTIKRHLAPHGTALIADPGRPYLQKFTELLPQMGLNYALIPKGNIYLLELRA